MKKLFLVLALMVGFAFLVPVQPAQAYTAQQCIDAHANPQGTIATWCHQNGWTVNSYIVVDPGLWVRWGDWANFRQCYGENGEGPNPCWWNFGSPPSYGIKYWFDVGHHQHNVNGLNL